MITFLQVTQNTEKLASWSKNINRLEEPVTRNAVLTRAFFTAMSPLPNCVQPPYRTLTITRGKKGIALKLGVRRKTCSVLPSSHMVFTFIGDRVTGKSESPDAFDMPGPPAVQASVKIPAYFQACQRSRHLQGASYSLNWTH